MVLFVLAPLQQGSIQRQNGRHQGREQALADSQIGVLARSHRRGATMIDSGTQFTLLLGEAYAPLREEFVQQNRAHLKPMSGNVAFYGALDLCYDLPTNPAQFPPVTPVTLLFDSAQVTLDAHHLLFRVPGIYWQLSLEVEGIKRKLIVLLS